MHPTSPVISEEFVPNEVKIAECQPEYLTLPSIIRKDGKVRLSRWTLTEDERAAVAAGADIFLYVHCVIQPPVLLEVAECGRDLMATARFMWLVDPPAMCFDCHRWVTEWVQLMRAGATPVQGSYMSGGSEPVCESCASPEEWERCPKLHA